MTGSLAVAHAAAAAARVETTLPAVGVQRAAWLLLDWDAQEASFRREPYPIELTQEEILERGLPEILATRLAAGQ